MEMEAVTKAANELASASHADVFLFNSEFKPHIGKTVARSVNARKARRDNVIVILVSEGGDPDAAYRVARLFQAKYKRFTAVISGWCKSAGTLCILGADELVFGEFGELGPLDIQYYKKDEISEQASGLVVREALTKLHTQATALFETAMLGIISKSNSQISFKVASDVAVRLAVGAFEPIYRQIDPMVLGDLERAMTIAKAYGERLLIRSKNYSSDTLSNLAEGYPSHGFVIDEREAKQLFRTVRSCNASEAALLNSLAKLCELPHDKGIIQYLSDEQGVSTHETEPKSGANAPELPGPDGIGNGRAGGDGQDSPGPDPSG